MRFKCPFTGRLGVRIRGERARSFYHTEDCKTEKRRITKMVSKGNGAFYYAEEKETPEGWKFVRYSTELEYNDLPKNCNMVPAMGPLVGEYTLRMSLGIVEPIERDDAA